MPLLNKLRSGIERKYTTTGAFTNLGYGQEWDKYIRTTSYGQYYGYGMGIDRAFCLSAFLTCIKIISEDVGSLPLFINRTRGERTDVDKSHPLYRILHDSPNPDMTAISAREAVTAHALTCGRGYMRVEYSKYDSGRIIALWPMQPGELTRDKDRAGRVVFVESGFGGKTYGRKHMFELIGFGTDGENGLDMLRYLREQIGLGLSQQEFASRFFAQQQIPPLVLEHPMTTDVPGVKKAWEEAHRGNQNWHTPAVLQEGMKANLLQYDMTKTQLEEQRAWQLLEVCRPFRMPPHKLGDMGRATWGNASVLNVNYYNECLRPWLVRWEQSVNHWLLGNDHPEWYAEHEIAGMQRGDFTQQTEGFRTLLASGVYSINEVRGYMNLNKIPGGDEHFIQINQGTVQQVAQGMTGKPGLQQVTPPANG